MSAGSSATRPTTCGPARRGTPGLRRPEQYAVRVRSGVDNRASLAEAALWKDNHWALLAAPRIDPGRCAQRLASQSVKDTLVACYEELRSCENTLEERRTALHFVPEFFHRVYDGVDLPAEPCFGGSQRRNSLLQRDVPNDKEINVAPGAGDSRWHGVSLSGRPGASGRVGEDRCTCISARTDISPLASTTNNAAEVSARQDIHVLLA